MPALTDVGPLSYYLAPVIAAVGAYVVARLSKGRDARDAAEAALIGTGPTIITELHKQMSVLYAEIGRLRNENEKIWGEVRQSRQAERECRDELEDMRRRMDIGWKGGSDAC